MSNFIRFCFFIFLISATSAFSQVYRCDDKSGGTVYQGHPCSNDYQEKTVVAPPREIEFMGVPVSKYEKISLDYSNVDIRNVIQVFSDFSDINMVIDNAVNGTLTYRKRDISWGLAFRQILHSKGLKYIQTSERSLFIYPKEYSREYALSVLQAMSR